MRCINVWRSALLSSSSLLNFEQRVLQSSGRKQFKLWRINSKDQSFRIEILGSVYEYHVLPINKPNTSIRSDATSHSTILLFVTSLMLLCSCVFLSTMGDTYLVASLVHNRHTLRPSLRSLHRVVHWAWAKHQHSDRLLGILGHRILQPLRCFKIWVHLGDTWKSCNIFWTNEKS